MFTKRTSDEEWVSNLLALAPQIEDICASLQSACAGVGGDYVFGWLQAAPFFQSLDTHKRELGALRNAVKRAGEPRNSTDLRMAASSLSAFMKAADGAFHWAELHYKDASGGPGQRAAREHGFAQRAALLRLNNNGQQFSEHCARAVSNGEVVLAVVRAKGVSYQPATPPLWSVFAAASGEELSGSSQLPMSDVAMVAAWCFRQSCVLGTILANDPGSALASIWDPARSDQFEETCRSWLEKAGWDETPPDSLGFAFLSVEYPDIYAADFKGGVSLGTQLKERERLAKRVMSAEAAASEWAIATALGYGIGQSQPELVLHSLRAEARGVSDEDWQRARRAGLLLSEQQPQSTVEEQIGDVIELCRPFFRAYYPEAFETLRHLG